MGPDDVQSGWLCEYDLLGRDGAGPLPNPCLLLVDGRTASRRKVAMLRDLYDRDGPLSQISRVVASNRLRVLTSPRLSRRPALRWSWVPSDPSYVSEAP